jgi:hypothetical protein
VRVRRPEGYALYALYPEPYALAARELSGQRLTCIGVRSIGTGLAGMVAAGAGSRRPLFAVRPGGHPFARTLEPSQLDGPLAGAAGAYAIVDEGPGLSGSTFAAVARALLSRGVPAARIHLFTGHPHPPGPEATAEVREIFQALPRHCIPLEDLLAGSGLLSPATLARELIGPAHVVGDLGDGRWRRSLAAGAWPPSTGWMERRKVQLQADGALWVARFAGLGREGERKLERARALGEAGLGIAAAGLRHGLLFERWESGAAPAAGRVPRPRVLDAVRRLIRFCAARAGGEGAVPRELADMAQANAAEALGREAGEAARWLDDLVPRVADQARPAEVDAKLQAWEWLALPGGRIVKCDALDHHAGHELSGCQDILWDVAGAEVELGLSPREATRLAEAARAVAPGADPALLPFYRTCYLALELGRWWTAARASPPGAERTRREAARERYRRLLARALAERNRARRREHHPSPAEGTVLPHPPAAG